MRLTYKEQSAIVHAFNETFNSGKIYLFGSRVDDKKRAAILICTWYLMRNMPMNIKEK